MDFPETVQVILNESEAQFCHLNQSETTISVVQLGYLLALHVYNMFYLSSSTALWEKAEYVNLDHECRLNHILKEENTIYIDPVQSWTSTVESCLVGLLLPWDFHL